MTLVVPVFSQRAGTVIDSRYKRFFRYPRKSLNMTLCMYIFSIIPLMPDFPPTTLPATEEISLLHLPSRLPVPGQKALSWFFGRKKKAMQKVCFGFVPVAVKKVVG